MAGFVPQIRRAGHPTGRAAQGSVRDDLRPGCRVSPAVRRAVAPTIKGASGPCARGLPSFAFSWSSPWPRRSSCTRPRSSTTARCSSGSRRSGLPDYRLAAAVGRFAGLHPTRTLRRSSCHFTASSTTRHGRVSASRRDRRSAAPARRVQFDRSRHAPEYDVRSRTRSSAPRSTIFGTCCSGLASPFSSSSKGCSSTRSSGSARSQGQPQPEHVHGNTTLEIIWTVIPAIILVVIAVPTVRTIFLTQAKARAERSTGRGLRPSMVVGVPLPAVRRHHGQRAVPAHRPQGEFRAPDAST